MSKEKIINLTPKYPVIPAKDKIQIQQSQDIMGQTVGNLRVSPQAVSVGDGNDIFKVTQYGIHLGNTDFNSAPFKVSMSGALTATSATISGSITATSGAIGGWNIGTNTIYSDSDEIILDSANKKITVGSSNPIIIDGLNKKIESDNYVSGLSGSGFHLDEDLLEVGNIAARGLIRTAVFQKNVISAIGGSFVVLDADVLDADMTSADNSQMTLKGASQFVVGDILRIRDGVDDEWFEITAVNGNVYTVTRDKAGAYGVDANPAWKKGATVVNYGQSGEGGIYMTASDTNAPYLSVFTHSGLPWTDLTTRLRVGNLNGFLDYTTDKYGIAIGETDNSLSYDPTNGLRITGTITGGVIRTAESGKRVEINSSTNSLVFYNETDNDLVGIGNFYTTDVMRINVRGDKYGLQIQNYNTVTTYPVFAARMVNASSTTSAGYFYNSGLGYAGLFIVQANASRTNATVKINAHDGQGAHLYLPPITTAPPSPSEGDIYTDANGFPYYYDGTAFRQFILSSGGTFTSFPVTPSSAPTADYEVVNKKYVNDSNKRYHRHNIGVFTKNLGDSSGTQSISHGILDDDDGNATPTLVVVHALCKISDTYFFYSHGSHYGMLTDNCVYMAYSFNGGSSSTYCVYLMNTDNNKGQCATITVDDTNITFNWTQVGGGLSEWAYVYWEAHL